VSLREQRVAGDAGRSVLLGCSSRNGEAGRVHGDGPGGASGAPERDGGSRS